MKKSTQPTIGEMLDAFQLRAEGSDAEELQRVIAETLICQTRLLAELVTELQACRKRKRREVVATCRGCGRAELVTGSSVGSDRDLGLCAPKLPYAPRIGVLEQ
jgi:hypothetical protein